MRPYHPCYHPFSWRGWWDFGTGCLGDIGCHQFSAAFKALKLGHPDSVEASSSNHPYGPEVANETAPLASITRWHFPAEGDRGRGHAHLVGRRPEAASARGTGARSALRRGRLAAGRSATRRRCTATGSSPSRKAREFGRPPKKLDRSPGHYQEWFDGLQGRQAGRLRLRAARGPSDRSRVAGQHRHPHQGEAALGRREPAFHEQRGGQQAHQPAVPVGLDTLVTVSPPELGRHEIPRRGSGTLAR